MNAARGDRVRFIDTNILLYRISDVPAERDKAEVAANLLQLTDLALSVQVLQEFYFQATRPTRTNRLSHDEGQAFIESWLRFPVQEMTVDVLRAALHSCKRFQLSYWDAAILEAARALKCREILSEDFASGRSYGGIRVVNPFQVTPRRSRPERRP